MTSFSQSPRDRILRILANNGGKMERSRLRTSPEKEEALITPDVLSSILLPAWQKRVTGVRADKKALLRQLVKRGYLLYTEMESIFTHHKKIEKKPKRVMVFDWAKVTGLDGGKQVHLLP